MAYEPPETEELIAILQRGHEAKDLDYKAAAAWGEKDKNACCALVKDILAMANTLGGFIAIGVSETPTGLSFDGVTVEQADSFDTSRVNRFLQKYADPSINALLRKINHDGKTFILIEVPPFSNTPHICRRDLPNVLSTPTLYVRTDNNESAPVASPADFQAVIERGVRNRGDALLASFRSILMSGTIPREASALEQFSAQRRAGEARFERLNTLKHEEPVLGYFEVSFLPEHFEAIRFTFDILRAAAERAQVTYTGWPFLYFDREQMRQTYVIQDGWETFTQDKDFAGFYSMDFWQLHQSGLLYYRTALRPSAIRLEAGTAPAADVKYLAIYIAQAIDCLTRLYDGLFDDNEYMSMSLRILNSDGRMLVNSGQGFMPLGAYYTCRIPEINIERRFPLAEWRAAVIDHAVQIANEVYLRFNWTRPNLELARSVIQRMFERRL
jgi:hypothetical protein